MATKKMIWPDKNTATLLQLSIERKIFEKFDGKKLTTKQIYTDLARQLMLNNIEATPEQCKVKIKNMKKAYQERRRAMSKSGAGTLPELPHQALLDQLLGGRPSTLASAGETGLDISFQDQDHQGDRREAGDVWEGFDCRTFRDRSQPQLMDEDDDTSTVEMEPAARAPMATAAATIRQNMEVAGPSGVRAVAGPSGVQAMAGPSGVQTVAGPSGVQTVAGPSGVQAVAGPSGVRAVAGPSGVRAVAGPSGVNRRPSDARRVAPYSVPARCRSVSTTSSGSSSSRQSSVAQAIDGPADAETASSLSNDDCSRAGQSEASQIIGHRSAAHGLSQAPRAVRRRTQRGQADPLDGVIAEMKESARADAANVAALQETEASMARHGEMLVQQGAQQLALCTQMVQLLQQLVQRSQAGDVTRP